MGEKNKRKKKKKKKTSPQRTHMRKQKTTTLNILWKFWSFVGCNTSIKLTRLMIWDKVAKNLRTLYSGTVSVTRASAIPNSLLSPKVWITSSDIYWSRLTVTQTIWNLAHPNRFGILTVVTTEPPCHGSQPLAKCHCISASHSPYAALGSLFSSALFQSQITLQSTPNITFAPEITVTSKWSTTMEVQRRIMNWS